MFIPYIIWNIGQYKYQILLSQMQNQQNNDIQMQVFYKIAEITMF